MSEETKAKGVTLFEKIEYGFGGMFKVGIGGYVVNTYWLFFLTNVAGIPTVLAATAYTIVKVMKIISMSVCGALVDSTNFKSGRYRTWVLIGDTGMFLLQGLLCAKLAISNNIAYIAIILVVYFIQLSCYNVSWTASRALVGVMATNTKDSVGLTAAASVGSTIAGIITGLMGPVVFGWFANSNNQYMWTSYVFALVYPLGCIAVMHMSKKYEIGADAKAAAAKKPAEKIPFKDMMACLKGPGLWFCLSNTIVNAGGIQQILLVYYTTYVLQNTNLTSYSITVGSVAGLVAALISPRLCAKFSKKGIYLSSLVLSGFCYAAYYFVSNGTGFLILKALTQLCSAPMGTAMVAMANDIADYNAMQGRASAKAFAQSMMGLSTRIGGLLCSLVATYGLVFIGYEAGTVPTESMLKAIIMLMSFVPAVAHWIAAGLILLYKIDENAIEEYKVAQHAAKAE